MSLPYGDPGLGGLTPGPVSPPPSPTYGTNQSPYGGLTNAMGDAYQTPSIYGGTNTNPSFQDTYSPSYNVDTSIPNAGIGTGYPSSFFGNNSPSVYNAQAQTSSNGPANTGISTGYPASMSGNQGAQTYGGPGPGGQQANPYGMGGQFPWSQIFNNDLGNRQLDQQQQWLDYQIKTYMPAQLKMQQDITAIQDALSVAQATGDYNGVTTLQNKLQQANINLQNYQANMQGVIAQAGLSGVYNGNPTLQAQQLMNQFAALGGNQNLSARGQDLGYAQGLMNLAGQTGAQDVGFLGALGNISNATGAQDVGFAQNLGNIATQTGAQDVAYQQALIGLGQGMAGADVNFAQNLGNIAGQVGNQNVGFLQGLGNIYGQNQQGRTGFMQGLGTLYNTSTTGRNAYAQNLANIQQNVGNQDVQMANIQAQLAQSPLVGWYTARGLPPPQSAIMTAQAPDLAQTLQTMGMGSGMGGAQNLGQDLSTLGLQGGFAQAPNIGQDLGAMGLGGGFGQAQNLGQTLGQLGMGGGYAQAPNLGQTLGVLGQGGQLGRPNLQNNLNAIGLGGGYAQAPNLQQIQQSLGVPGGYSQAPNFQQLQQQSFGGLGRFTPPGYNWNFQSGPPGVQQLPITGGVGNAYNPPSQISPVMSGAPAMGGY